MDIETVEINLIFLYLDARSAVTVKVKRVNTKTGSNVLMYRICTNQLNPYLYLW